MTEITEKFFAMADNEFPIRIYDHEFGGSSAGLSEIIFSSRAGATGKV